MKLHKLTVYIMDHDNLGSSELVTMIENEIPFSHVIANDTVKIDWPADDEIDINKPGATEKTFEKYFKK